MKKLTVVLMVLCNFYIIQAQKSPQLFTNDELISELVSDYINEGLKRHIDLTDSIINKIDFIVVAPDSITFQHLAISNRDKKSIVLFKRATIDFVVYKYILFRELSYMLGIDYNTNILMNLYRERKFSYSIFEDTDILDIELTEIFYNIKNNDA